MRDSGDRLGDAGDAARRKHKRVAPRQDHLEDLGPLADIGERRLESGAVERVALAGADHLAAEAEAAVDGARLHDLQKHAVRVAVDDPRDGRMGVVADRVGALLGSRVQLFGRRQELAADGTVGALFGDQLDHRRRDGNGVAPADVLGGRSLGGVDHPCFHKVARAAQCSGASAQTARPLSSRPSRQPTGSVSSAADARTTATAPRPA